MNTKKSKPVSKKKKNNFVRTEPGEEDDGKVECRVCRKKYGPEKLKSHLRKKHDISMVEYDRRMRDTNRKRIGIAAVISAGVLVALCVLLFMVPPGTGEENEGGGPGDTGFQPEAAKDFTQKEIVSGSSIRLSSYEGRPVLLNFVNYGCNDDINAIVSDQLMIIRSLVRQGIDFQPVSVFCGCCGEDTLKDFAVSNGFDWPWILDLDNSILTTYAKYTNRYGYPTLLFIDSGGMVQDASGFMGESQLEDALVGLD